MSVCNYCGSVEGNKDPFTGWHFCGSCLDEYKRERETDFTPTATKTDAQPPEKD